jgi:cell division protein FtsX
VNRHSLHEVRRQVRESGSAGLVAVVLIMVATAWGGVLWTARHWVLTQLLARDRATTVIAVLRSQDDTETVSRALVASFAGITPVAMTPRQVQDELSRWFPEISSVLLGLDSETFPALVQINVPPSRDTEVAAWLRLRPEVALVESSRAWQSRLENTMAGILAFGFGLAFTLLVACCAVVLLVVRLLVIEHADEIAIMRLIGAHETDIRLPYLVCGAILGTAGGLLGAGLLVVASLALHTILPSMTVSPYVAGALPIGGAVAGTLGALIGIASLPSEP